MVAQATPDECFQGNVNNSGGITAAQITANNTSFNSAYPPGLTAAQIASCISSGYLPKTNQAYVWGLTMDSTGNLWLGTVANTLCLVLDEYYGNNTYPYENGDYVCDAQQNPEEDFKPPRMFMYNPGTNTLTDLTPKILMGGDASLLTKTFGIRSAGYFNGVVFFGGLETPAPGGIVTPVVMYAFNAQTQQYLGSYVFDGKNGHPYYNNIRQWHVINNNLFTGVGKPNGTVNGGAMLRWTGTLANPYSFIEVGEFPGGQPAYFTAHTDGHIYATTWGSGGAQFGMSLYMSPPLNSTTGLDTSDAGNWTEVWNLNQYEVEPSVVELGGAVQSFNGYVYFGTMQVPVTSDLSFEQMYPNATVSEDSVILNTNRPIQIFRTQGFDPTLQPTPSVELLYGSANLEQYNQTTDSWNLVPNGMGGVSPTYGAAGFGAVFNNYTWSMAVFQDQLYVGTMNWAYIAANNQLSSSLPPALTSLAPSISGAELWTFANTASAATAVNVSGMGNPYSYGIRTMVTDNNDLNLWLGMANPMNLRTDATNDPGGWKLIDFPTQNGAPIITWYNPAAIVYGTPLTATQLDATATQDGTYTYNPPLGTVLNVGAGQMLSLTFTPFSGGNQYSDTVKINVTPEPLTATAANASMIYGAPVPSPFAGTLVGVVNNDPITATYTITPAVTSTSPAGTYTIMPVLSDPKTRLPNYSTTLINGTLTIAKAGTTSTVFANAPTVFPMVLTAQVVSATTGTPTGTVNFYDGTTLLGSGMLGANGFATFSATTLASGTHSISVQYGGDGNFTVSTSQPIQVAGIPFITWPAPVAIVYGTPLTVTQLNATSNETGTFTYIPPMGTVLTAGANQVLTANFTPLNSSNVYSNTVKLTVNQAPLAVTATNVECLDDLRHGGTIAADGHNRHCRQ